MEDGMEDAVSKESIVGRVNATIKATGKPLMIWRLGCESRGWIPSEKHFEAVRDFIKKARLDNRYDVFLYHFGVHVQIIEPRPWYRRIFG